MKTTMALFAGSLLLAAAVSAPAQAPAQSSGQPAAQPAEAPAPAPARPRLKLRLDEADEARPRINFTPRDGDSKQDPGSSLPTLGGKPSGAWEQTPSSVVPKDSTPGL